MKQFIKDYFTFNRRERNGVFVLLGIMAMLIATQVYESSVEAPELKASSDFERQVAAAFAASAVIDSDEVMKTKPVKSNQPDRPRAAERFAFDPNTATEKEWQRLGLSGKDIRMIEKFLGKGGRFRKKEDLKKIYCVTDELYQSLEPWIIIANENKQPVPARVMVSTQMPVVELNSCDSAALTKVKGLGPFFARQIIRYRTQLGGFVSKLQLLEVWKFDEEKYALVEKFLTVDPLLIRRININSCTAAELQGPYIRWNAANAIVNYRKSHGKFKNVDELKNTDLVDEETLRKIAPYLNME